MKACLKHQKNGESICFIAGRAGETRFVQVITNGTVRQYDGAQGFCFGEEGVAAELPGVQGALRYGPLSPLRTDIMGPFRFLPMQCSHSVYSMAHTLAGGFTVDGRFIDLTGGTGYIEGDRGSAFPRDYLWDLQPCSVMAFGRAAVRTLLYRVHLCSVAHIPSFVPRTLCWKRLQGAEAHLCPLCNRRPRIPILTRARFRYGAACDSSETHRGRGVVPAHCRKTLLVLRPRGPGIICWKRPSCGDDCIWQI